MITQNNTEWNAKDVNSLSLPSKVAADKCCISQPYAHSSLHSSTSYNGSQH